VEYSSLNPIVNDETSSHRDYLYFAFMSWQRAIRDKRYKLIEYCVEGSRYTQLFDLIEDEHETNNLAGDPKHGATLGGLRRRLEKTRVILNDGNTPFDFTDEQGKNFWSIYHSVKDFETP
jgi:arylsulfatase A-like enzyme